MEAQGDQLIQELQQAVSQGATIEQLAPQILQMTKGDPNMAVDLLVQAGFSKNQVSQEIDAIANQMEQQAMNQSQQSRPTPQVETAPQGGQEQASAPAQAGMPAMNMGGTARDREPQNPFVQMMQQGGKPDFESFRKEMLKEYRKGGVSKESMDTSSTEAYVGDMKKRLTSKMFAGYAVNKLGNDFKQMQEAAINSMKYGGLAKAENGIVVGEDGISYFDPEQGEYNEGLKEFGINSIDELKALDNDKYVQVITSLNKSIFDNSDIGKEAANLGFTFDDVTNDNANFNTALKPFRDQQVKDQDIMNSKGSPTKGQSYDDWWTADGSTPGFKPDNRIWDGSQWVDSENSDLQKKLTAYGVTEEEYLADPELKKEIDEITIGSSSGSTVDRIKNSTGYKGTEEQQKIEKDKAEAEQKKQIQATKNTNADNEETKTLAGTKFDMSTANFLTRPLTDIVQGVAGVKQAFGEKELTDQIQFKGKGAMAGMSKDQMAEALRTGAIKTGSIGDMYTKRDARRLARGKTNRGIFGGFEEINPYGKRVYFDQTPVDAANNVEPNPDVNIDPNNPAQGYQQNDYQNEIDAQYETALSNLSAQGINNPTKDQLNNAIDMVEQVRGMSGVPQGEMQPDNWMENYDQYVQKLGGMSPEQLFQMALGGIIVSENQLKYDRPFMPFMQGGGSVPKGYHIMPDGSMMADADHYKGGGYVVEKYPDGGTKTPKVKQRRGTRENFDGHSVWTPSGQFSRPSDVSSHLMKAEYVDGRGWVAFPSLFQDSKPYADDSRNWVDMSDEKDGWWPIYEEAERRGEVYDFGEDKEAALAFGKGSWKNQLPTKKGGGVGGYKNEGYVDFEPIYESEVDFGQIASGVYQTGAGVNEMLENINRFITPEERADNRNVNSIFTPRNRGSLIEGKYDPQTGQMAAQDAGDTILAGQMGDRAVRQRRGVTDDFMAKYGLEVGQEVTLSQNELRALKSAGYILTPKK